MKHTRIKEVSASDELLIDRISYGGAIGAGIRAALTPTKLGDGTFGNGPLNPGGYFGSPGNPHAGGNGLPGGGGGGYTSPGNPHSDGGGGYSSPGNPHSGGDGNGGNSSGGSSGGGGGNPHR